MQDQQNPSAPNPTGKGGWQKGQSGNPGGRAKMPQAVKDMLSVNAEKAVKAIVKFVDDGDPRVALKAAELLLDRAYGKPQTASENIDLGELGDTATPEGLLALHGAMIAAAAGGKVQLAEAKEFSALLESHRRLVETVDLEARIAKLEKEKPQ